MNNSICTLFDNILIDIHKFKSLHHIQRKRRKNFEKMLQENPNIETSLTDFNLFHRTRLKDIPNNQIYTLDKFKQLCIDAGLNFKELIKRERIRLQKR